MQNKLLVTNQAIVCLTCAICAWVLDDCLYVYFIVHSCKIHLAQNPRRLFSMLQWLHHTILVSYKKEELGEGNMGPK